MYEDVLALLHKTNVSYENSNTNQYSIMRPIGSYARLGLQGTPSKSLFLKSKSGDYYVFLR